MFLDGAQTVLDAAQAMKRHRAKSILVRAGERIGIFTASDFRDIILTGTPASATLADTAHFNLVTTDAGDYLFNALLTMTRHNIQRVVVTENGQPIGVLEQIDLLSYFSNHSHPDCPANRAGRLAGHPEERGRTRSTGWWACCPATASKPATGAAGANAERPAVCPRLEADRPGRAGGKQLPDRDGQRRPWRTNHQDRPGQRADSARRLSTTPTWKTPARASRKR